MAEFWHKTTGRARETLAIWRRLVPLMTVGGTTPDLHAARVEALDALGQARADRQADAAVAKSREVAGFTFIRTLNLAVPKLIEGRLAEGHPLREALAAVYALVPRSDALNLQRARVLIPIWRKADAELAARQPGDAITREAVGWAEFAQAVEDYPALVQATADAEAALALAISALRQQDRAVDRMNKRAYLKLSAEARDRELTALLRASVTTENSSRKRTAPRPRLGKARASGFPGAPLMPLLDLDLPGIRKIASGKVREIFDLGDCLLLVATDRLSAFDCILPSGIPGKGEVLTSLSRFWFERFGFVENHLLARSPADLPAVLQGRWGELSGRSMVVKKARPLPVECVVRGYLAGSGWKEYQGSQSIGGHGLPAGLPQAERLPEALFTPSTKAVSGHDANISWDECRRLVGEEVAGEVRALSLRLYEEGRAFAAARGIIVADTKFEFGLFEGRVILIDECLTPDSSRFWPADEYRVGMSPPSYDKQFVRDYLETLAWDKTPPAPALPTELIRRTSEKYLEARARLTN